MAKAAADIRSLARSHAPGAIKVLAGIMNEKKAPAAARVKAAEALIDRGFGKPKQTIEADGKLMLEHIERIVVSSSDSDS